MKSNPQPPASSRPTGPAEKSETPALEARSHSKKFLAQALRTKQKGK
jgi:hypothetical protein